MKKRKRRLSLLVASALAMTTLLSFPGSTVSSEALTTYEFEQGVIDRAKLYDAGWTETNEAGDTYDCTNPSGDGFVYLTDKGSSVTCTVEMEQAGLYHMNIRYLQPNDTNKKVQYLNINGSNQGEVTFPYNMEWSEISTLVNLREGSNTIELRGYWGYTYLDSFTLTPADESISRLSPTDSLSNPNANDTTKRLYAYLRSVYGNHILSGQQEMCGSHNYNYNADPSAGFIVDNEAEFTYLQEKTGKQPAIRGIDFLTYHLDANGELSYQDYAAERAIEWTNKYGGIATISWHWSVPSSTGEYAFYVESANANYTDFSISKAVTEGTREHEIIMKDIELVASKFQMLEDADVSVIFRPLHEAEGAWFWWGAEGPEPCVKLYRLLYDQLTNVYGLDNIIWEWTSYTTPNSAAWYPGDDVVDLIGYDKYNVSDGLPNPSAIASTFYGLVESTNGQKMVAMSENDAIPSLENLVNDRAAWLYFCPWYGYYLTGEVNNPVELLNEIYNSEYCITLDELPDIRSFPLDAPVTTAATTQGTGTVTTTTSTVEALYGDINLDGNIGIDDVVLLARYVAEDNGVTIQPQGLEQANCSYDNTIDADDLTALARYLAHLITADALGPQA